MQGGEVARKWFSGILHWPRITREHLALTWSLPPCPFHAAYCSSQLSVSPSAASSLGSLRPLVPPRSRSQPWRQGRRVLWVRLPVEERPAWERAGGQPPLPPMDLVSLGKLRQTNPRKKKEGKPACALGFSLCWAGCFIIFHLILPKSLQGKE